VSAARAINAHDQLTNVIELILSRSDLLIAYLICAAFVGLLGQRMARMIMSVALSMICTFVTIAEAGYRTVGGPRYAITVAFYLVGFILVAEAAACAKRLLSDALRARKNTEKPISREPYL
jgi:K+-sensing histidine kinase KdpD